MKELVFNEDNLKEVEINSVVTRVKVLLLNSANEILLGYCDGIYQFPGGHVENNESLIETANREIKEETGIELNLENLTPFYCIKHYSKNYNGTSLNRLSQIYYFCIKTDEKINLHNTSYTQYEESGNYKLEYIDIEKIEDTLKRNIPNNVRNSIIVEEMLAVIEASGIKCEKNIKVANINHIGTKTITTERLIIRKFEEKDAEQLFFGYMNQEEFLYYAHKEKRSLEDVKELLKKKKEKYKNLDYYNWVIALKESDTVIGAINLNVNVYNESVEFNYAIDNRYINNGYMTEALSAIRDFSLNELKVNRFQGGCCIENLASKRVMEKCGMKYEGMLRNYIKLKDGYHDMYMFSIINKESI